MVTNLKTKINKTYFIECVCRIRVSLGERDIRRRGGADCFKIASSWVCSTQPRQFAIERVHVHRYYNKYTLAHDIALVRLVHGEHISAARSKYVVYVPQLYGVVVIEHLTLIREVPGSKPEHGGFFTTDLGKVSEYLLDDGAGRR
jgi:hypothetical protein